MMKRLLCICALTLITYAQYSEDRYFRARQYFATKFFTTVGFGKDGNFVVSPLSVDISLHVLLAGASGTNSKELTKSLEYPQNITKMDIETNSKNLVNKIKSLSSVSMATKVYISNKNKLQVGFKATAKKVYHAETETINFANPGKATEKINGWVANVTKDKIKDLLSSESVSPKTIMVLVNAIYFKSTWKYQFDPSMTTKSEFHINSENSITIDFMNIEQEFKYIDGMWALNGSMAVELPYSDPGVSMIFIKPGYDSTFEGMLECVNKYPWKDITERMRLTSMKVSIPKFNIAFKEELNEHIKKMGMEAMFKEQGSFNNAVNGADGKPAQMKVDYIIQQAIIEVDEVGTTAAAATATISRSMKPSFVADSPFLFILRSETNILFIGQFTGITN